MHPAQQVRFEAGMRQPWYLRRIIGPAVMAEGEGSHRVDVCPLESADEVLLAELAADTRDGPRRVEVEVDLAEPESVLLLFGHGLSSRVRRRCAVGVSPDSGWVDVTRSSLRMAFAWRA